MFTETTHSRPQISPAEMRGFLEHGWGKRGIRVAECWHEYNERFFEGQLEPLPISLVNTSPHGRWLGLTSGISNARRTHLIQLTSPGSGQRLVADRGVLLHEMIHQHLIERGCCPKHDGQPWCDEIMRIHHEITGERFWAAPEKILKVADEKGRKRSKRVAPCCPETGQESLRQRAIGTWPHSVGLKLGQI